MSPDPATPALPSASRSLWRAGAVLKDAPLEILAPSAGILGTQVLLLLWLRAALDAAPLPWEDPEAWRHLGLQAAAVGAAVVAIRSPLRALIFRAGAASLHRKRPAGLAALGGFASMALVDGARGALSWLLWGMIALPSAAIATTLAAQGALTPAAVILAVGLVIGGALAFGVRVLFAYAPLVAILDARTPWRALSDGWIAGRGDRIRVGLVLLMGDLLTGLGGLFCLVGALPGYPIGPLALLIRYDARAPGTPEQPPAPAASDASPGSAARHVA